MNWRTSLVAACMALTVVHGAGAADPQWTYRYADLQFGRFETRLTVSEAVQPTGLAERYVARALPTGRQVLEYAPYALSSGEPPGSWPMPSGYPTYATPYLEWRYTVKPGGWESVTVPAGTFKAFRVTVTGERGKDPDPYWWPKQAMRFEQTFWYSPEAKRYVKSIHRAWNMNNADFAHDLVELVDVRP